MKKIERIIVVCLVLLLLPTSDIAFASNAETALTIEATSYDYIKEITWGWGGIRYWRFDDYETVDINYFNIDYVGLSEQRKQDILNNPGAWSKCWVRFDVLPNLRFAPRTSEQYDEIVASSGVVDQLNPLHMNSLFIQNVRIANSEEIGVYPKDNMMIAGRSPSIEKLVRIKEADTWYMELLIENRGRDDAALDKAIKEAAVVADVGIFIDSFRWNRDYPISLANCDRQVLYEEEDITFYATAYREVTFDSIDYDETAYATTTIPLDVQQDAIRSPEKYRLLELGLYLDKKTEQGICTIVPALPENENEVWFFYGDQDDLTLAKNDKWKNGEQIPLNRFYILIRADKQKEVNLEAYLRKLQLSIVFSTEFAGVIFWDGETEGRWGYSGMRFVKEINMSKIQYNEDAFEYPIYY